MAEKRIRVLFLCTGNVCRSPMAEALLREIGGERFDVHSAGCIPSEIHPLALRALAEIGIDAGEQYSKHMDLYLNEPRFDYVITLCDRIAAVAPKFPGEPHRLHWPVEDPIWASGSVEECMVVFRRVRDELAERIREFVEEVTGGGSESDA